MVGFTAECTPRAAHSARRPLARRNISAQRRLSAVEWAAAGTTGIAKMLLKEGRQPRSSSFADGYAADSQYAAARWSRRQLVDGGSLDDSPKMQQIRPCDTEIDTPARQPPPILDGYLWRRLTTIARGTGLSSLVRRHWRRAIAIIIQHIRRRQPLQRHPWR